MNASSGLVRGDVVELFSGLQGEGTHVGRRQIFLRLAGCNLACDYCDQPEARQAPAQALIEMSPGGRRFLKVSNPLPVAVLLRAILRLNVARQGEAFAGARHALPLRAGAAQATRLHSALAITGGEPLMQADFLAALLPALRRSGLRIFLETNGTRARELARLRSCVDIVSMDIKLRSATGRPMPRKAHVEFLRAARRIGVELYAKAVVSSSTTEREISGAARILRTHGGDVPLILQPVTRLGKNSPRPPTSEALLRLQAAAARQVGDVRVIPQTHKMIGQR